LSEEEGEEEEEGEGEEGENSSLRKHKKASKKVYLGPGLLRFVRRRRRRGEGEIGSLRADGYAAAKKFFL
jgi:hypothetical protein